MFPAALTPVDHSTLKFFEMSNPTDETELRRLKEEKDAILAWVVICKAAQASVEALQSSQSITKEHQHNTPSDDKRVISSSSELTKANIWRSSRYSQSNKLYHASRKVARTAAFTNFPESNLLN